jgi:hypothetical protein
MNRTKLKASMGFALTRHMRRLIAAGMPAGSSTMLIGSWRPRHRPRSPVLPRCSGSQAKSRMRQRVAQHGHGRSRSWHYQLRATMAAAIEALLAGKAVRS